MNARSGTIVQAQVFSAAEGTLQKQGNMATNFPAGTQTYLGSLLTGSGFSAQLWAGTQGTAESSLTPVVGSLTTFRTGAFAGFWAATPAAVAIIGVPEGGIATLQVRVWDNAGGTITSYDVAQTRGVSALFLSTPLGGIGTPPVLENARSFNLTTVPEPSTFVLAGLGAAGLLIFRRRK